MTVIHPGSQHAGRQDNNQSPEEVQVNNAAVKCVGADWADCVTLVGKPVSMNCACLYFCGIFFFEGNKVNPVLSYTVGLD